MARLRLREELSRSTGNSPDTPDLSSVSAQLSQLTDLWLPLIGCTTLDLVGRLTIIRNHRSRLVK